jgi:organic radical activating enzyme
MPNIIINNYCNQKCSYCFANQNMNNKDLQKDMTLNTYIKILKFLKRNNDNNVRILWWEPLLSPNIRKFLQIANKWWFDIIVFSNINIDSKILFKTLNWLNNIRINCNINEKKFYSEEELKKLNINLYIINKLWLKIIIWHNILEINNKPIDFIFNLAQKNNIKAINLKITNHFNTAKLNNSRKFWKFLFNIIKKYEKDFFIEFSCWLNKNIFLPKELEYIKNYTNISLKFWCNWNIWKFDINTNWKTFRCFPLQETNINKSIYIENNLNLNKITRYFANNTSYKKENLCTTKY